ncbi:hypothetical protein HFN16_03195 [Pseudodesulfovibrio sp. zrk46]|nr:hypothetical protein HFN16_03195 [Pseudodesulfovibrio sp. zrk46]
MFEAGGFTFLIDKELLGQTGKVKIDMTYYGFVVESEKPVGGGGGCSGGSCGTDSGGCSSSGCSC